MSAAEFALAAVPLEDVLGEVLTAEDAGDHPEVFRLAMALAARAGVAEADGARLRTEGTLLRDELERVREALQRQKAASGGR